VNVAAGKTLPAALGTVPWVYLSGFYANPRAGRGHATATLKQTLAALRQPVILCCEPILGSDPRALTERTAHLTDTERYAKLCQYYRREFNLTLACPIDCTLRTTITGRGRRWNGDRHFLWGLINPSTIFQDVPIEAESREQRVLLS